MTNMLMATANSCRALAEDIRLAAAAWLAGWSPEAHAAVNALTAVADLLAKQAESQELGILRDLAGRCQDLAREIAARGRIVGHQSLIVSRTIRRLYGLAKTLSDESAREQALLKPPTPTVGRKTNVGDPLPTGQNPGVQKGGGRRVA